MFRILKITLFAISTTLLFCYCSSSRISKIDNSSIIAISAKTSGLAANGYGIVITLENMDTHERYESRSFSPMSAHSVIPNIPPGQYIVRKVEVPVGNFTYSNWSDGIRDFFGQINIESNSKYYMGNFSGTREIGRKNVLRLTIESQEIPEKVKEKIEKDKTGWKSGDFIKLYPYEKEELLVY